MEVVDFITAKEKIHFFISTNFLRTKRVKLLKNIREIKNRTLRLGSSNTKIYNDNDFFYNNNVSFKNLLTKIDLTYTYYINLAEAIIRYLKLPLEKHIKIRISKKAQKTSIPSKFYWFL